MVMRELLFGLLMVGPALPGCRKSIAPLTAAPPDWMESATLEEARKLAPEATVVDPVYPAVAYKSGQLTQWQLHLKQGHCYLFSAVGDESVEGSGKHAIGVQSKK